MIIRLSNDMQKKVHLRLTETAPPSPSFLLDWALHLFRYQGRQYIIVTNTTSLFSTVVAGKGVRNQKSLVGELLPTLIEAHRAVGFGGATGELESVQVENVSFSKVGNRVVTGSMNQIITYTQYMMDEEPEDLGELTRMINQNIFTFTNYHRAEDVHRRLLRL